MLINKNNHKHCLANFTTLRIGGPAEALFEVNSHDELVNAAEEAEKMGLPWRVIGHGSNIIAADDGVSEAIIVFKSGETPKIMNDGTVLVSGGFPLNLLVQFLAERSFGGLEMLAGIPGTVGGAITGNAGAYGESIGNHVRKVRLMGRNGCIREAGADELGFAYRHSALKETGEAVIEAIVETTPRKSDLIKNEIQKKLEDRANKHPDPVSVPTAGSWFKNVADADGKMSSAGKLLEEAGCRTLSVGGAYIWPKHANIIVTDGRANAHDVLELAGKMADRVYEKFGVKLIREVCGLGVK